MSVFSVRLARERAARSWSYRELAAKTGVSPMGLNAAERGSDLRISTAEHIAAAFGLSLVDMLTPPDCTVCHDAPPPGFTCNECGRTS